jgi:hypothetical protein
MGKCFYIYIYTKLCIIFFPYKGHVYNLWFYFGLRLKFILLSFRLGLKKIIVNCLVGVVFLVKKLAIELQWCNHNSTISFRCLHSANLFLYV